MNEQEIMDSVSDYLETIKDNTVERLKFINTMLDYFMFHKRLSELKPHEIIAFGKALNGGELNDRERKRLEELTSEEEKDNYIGQIARTNYFRRCAWLNYLHGEPNSSKPHVSEPEIKYNKENESFCSIGNKAITCEHHKKHKRGCIECEYIYL